MGFFRMLEDEGKGLPKITLKGVVVCAVSFVLAIIALIKYST